MRVALVAAAFGALAASACDTPRERFHTERLLAMATWVDVTLETRDLADEDELLGEIERMLRAFERDYYAWGDGELAKLNAALARGEPLRVAAELAALLRAAQLHAQRSAGTFEPAVGDIVELWGFHSEAARPDSPPEAGDVDDWLRRDAGIRHLRIAADGTVNAVRPPGKIDLGGIAKGAAVDRIVEMLATAGVDDALVNAGGDVRVLGTPHGRPWRIGIQAPRGTGILGVLEVESGEAVFTSGDYERFYEVEGRRMHHIIDPATGYPVSHTQAVTVITADGVTADAAATALLVAGPERWRAIARNLDVAFVLRIDATGAVETTAQMRDRLQPSAGTGSDIIAAGSTGGSH